MYLKFIYTLVLLVTAFGKGEGKDIPVQACKRA
jgi:hypothetical protein